jgi:hypothetical protein
MLKGRMAVPGEVERNWKKPAVALQRSAGRTYGTTHISVPVYSFGRNLNPALPDGAALPPTRFDISFENMFPNLVESGTFSTLKMLEHYAVVTAKV